MIRHDFDKLNRLPPYVLAEVIDMMKSARREGHDIVDLGMGNPDLPTPPHTSSGRSATRRAIRATTATRRPGAFPTCAPRSASGTSGVTPSTSIPTTRPSR